MQSIVAYFIAEGIQTDPVPFPRRSRSKPGLVARLRHRVRPAASADRVDAWIEVPELTGYPTAR